MNRAALESLPAGELTRIAALALRHGCAARLPRWLRVELALCALRRQG